MSTDGIGEGGGYMGWFDEIDGWHVEQLDYSIASEGEPMSSSIAKGTNAKEESVTILGCKQGAGGCVTCEAYLISPGVG